MQIRGRHTQVDLIKFSLYLPFAGLLVYQMNCKKAKSQKQKQKPEKKSKIIYLCQ